MTIEWEPEVIFIVGAAFALKLSLKGSFIHLQNIVGVLKRNYVIVTKVTGHGVDLLNDWIHSNNMIKKLKVFLLLCQNELWENKGN